MTEQTGVLIVDDSATSRMIIQRCLEMAGIRSPEYRQAENGMEALAMLKTGGIGLVVTDLNMPKMDGRAFARVVKSDSTFSGVDLVVVSSVVDGDIEAELRSLGVAAVVKKPVTPAKLREALGGIL